MAYKTIINPDGTSENYEETINLSDMVARRAATLLMGNGFEIVGPDQDLLLEELDSMNFLTILSRLEMKLSKEGEAVLIIDFHKKNRPRITIAESGSIFSRDADNKIIWAQTVRKITYGVFEWLITERWTKTEKKTIVQNAMGQIFSLDAYNQRVSPQFQVYDFKYKEIPLVYFTNTVVALADASAVKNFQTQIDQMMLSWRKESFMNVTRMGINAGNKKLIEDIQRKGLAAAINDTFMFVDSDANRMDDDRSKDIQVYPAQPIFQSYVQGVEWLIDAYFEAAGYSGFKDAQATQTVIGTLFTNKKDMETTRLKKSIREKALAEFLRKYIAIRNTIKVLPIAEKHTISLKPNIMFDEQQKLEFMRVGVEYQLLTKKKMIALYYNTTDEELIETIAAELEEDQIKRLQEMMVAQKEFGGEPDAGV